MPTQPYKNAKGIRIPSQSTVKSQIGWGSGPLSYWHWKQGHEGVEWKDIYKSATTPGTIAHLMIECHLKGIEPDLKEFNIEHLELANTAFQGFLSWQEQWEVVPKFIEPNLVSEVYQYGGTPDLVCTVKGKWALADWKTGKGPYAIIFVQLEAYRRLIKENYNIELEEYHVLRIPKNENIVSFHHSRWDQLPDQSIIAFDSALNLYRCEKELNKYL